MKIKNCRTMTMALLLGAFLPANLAQAQNPAAPAPKPAGGQPIGFLDYDLDGSADLYVANYFALGPKGNPTLPAQNAEHVNYANWLNTTETQRLALLHAGTTACTSCHSVTGWVTDKTPSATRVEALTSRDAFATFFAVQSPADAALGATLQPIEDSVRTQLGLKEKTGLLVASLLEEGAAAKAGLQRNDILLTLADAPLAEAVDLPEKLKIAGEKDVPLTLLRAGKTLTLQVRPVTRMTFAVVEPQKVAYRIGVSATPPDDVLRAHVELPAGQGLLVNEIVAESPAEKSGVKKYDILLKIDDTPLDKTETLSAKVQAVGGKPAKLSILRSTKTITITVTPEPRKVATANSTDNTSVHYWTALANPLNIQSHKGMTYNVPLTTRYNAQVPLQHTVNAIQPPQASADPSTMAKRLDNLDKEMKALRKAIEDIRDSVKKEK